MDFKDSQEEVAFRQEVRRFIRENLPDELKPQNQARRPQGEMFAAGPAQRQWTKALADRKWIAPAWPAEYGGAGLSVMQQFIFNEEMAEARAPRPGGIATGFAGPTLIVHGTEEQKQKYLPEILSGDTIWCQGYSEPGAGSDLASLQTRAVRDGDDYVVSGQKIWTTGAQYADWCFLLVRTDPDAPKHKGISFLLVDMKTPGITIRPLIDLAGGHHVNET